MKPIKFIFGNVRTRIWAIVSIVLTVLLVVVTALSSSVYYETICMAIGGKYSFGRGEEKYFSAEAESKEDAYRRGNALNEEICEEGFVLLKNENGALPLGAGAKISVFGKNSVSLVYGGTGSGGGNYDGAVTLYSSLRDAGFEVNPVLEQFYLDNARSGEGRTPNPKIENDGNVRLATGETPLSSYSAEVKGSYASYRDAAIVVFSRIGGEGFDLPRTMPSSKGHYLELDENEKALLREVKSGFSKVIVLVNCSTSFEMGELERDPEIDACVCIGGPGYSGAAAIGRLLNGSRTFSGKTVDTWAADFTADPTWNNFGNNLQENGATYYTVENGARKDLKYYYVDYEENIYVGYRYYETRGAQDEEWYRENVVYPFGFGLSYTQFSWEILNADEFVSRSLTEQNKQGEIEVEVRVTNTGTRKGKDVVELYCDLPQGRLEKSATVLCAFAKTPELYPSAENAADGSEAAGSGKPNSAVVTLRFSPYYLASYDEADADGDGMVGYTLEKGDYALRLKTDAHRAKEGTSPLWFSLPHTVTYGEDPVTGTKIENRFQDAKRELDTLLSRTDWGNTWPTLSQGRELTVSGISLEELKSLEHNAPQTEWEEYRTDVHSSKKLIEMRGLPYDDEGWDEILDSLSFREMRDLFNEGAFKTKGIPEIGLPDTISSDGPVGFVNFVSGYNIYGTVSYASEYVMGSTWNTELLQRFGESVGEEGIFGKEDVDPYVPYSGWYAPGMNLHRSPFGGRNFEYFSEDPYLTGMLAAAQIRGAQSKGVITYMKHFALNEQETHRDDNGVCTWATEQAIRELYLRPFEIAVKTAAPKGIMTSFNRIGTRWTGGDHRLLTQILREEWGFCGTVISDFNVSLYMNPKQMIYAGGDLNLTTTRPWMNADPASASDVAVLRRAAHNILYTVVNSNAMNGVDEHTVFTTLLPLWQIILIAVDCVAAVALAVWGAFELRAAKKKEEKASEDAEKSD